MNTQTIGVVIGLDVGMARTGVAIINSLARIGRPLCTVEGIANLPSAVADIIKEQNAIAVVVGLPRNLSGQDTDQTRFVREEVEKMNQVVSVPIYFTDEAMTSVRAEEELRARKKPFQKADIDMLAAVYILEDYTSQHPEVYEVT